MPLDKSGAIRSPLELLNNFDIQQQKNFRKKKRDRMAITILISLFPLHHLIKFLAQPFDNAFFEPGYV